MISSSWDYAIVVTDATKAPMVARRLLKQERPFALLCPTDLLHVVYDPVAGGAGADDPGLKAKLKAASKFVFSAENLTWIIGNWPGTTTEILASEPAKASGEVCLERSRTDYSGMFFSPGRPCSREAPKAWHPTCVESEALHQEASFCKLFNKMRTLPPRPGSSKLKPEMCLRLEVFFSSLPRVCSSLERSRSRASLGFSSPRCGGAT